MTDAFYNFISFVIKLRAFLLDNRRFLLVFSIFLWFGNNICFVEEDCWLEHANLQLVFENEHISQYFPKFHFDTPF